MQSLQPSLKMMRMLDNNGLLDEKKLAFLIDLDRKEPKAIQKLLHDGKIDPMDLDASADPSYQPGNHSVSAQEMAFHTALEDTISTQPGQETVALINSQWDQASKEVLYREPEILQIITTQRANGIYDRISAEIEKEKILGNLGNVPFLTAYRTIGDKLHTQGKLLPAEAAEPSSAKRVVETRTAAPKRTTTNGDKAKAAQSATTAPKATPKEFDPYVLSDEEFLEQTKLRV
jgi:hypothetical protein